MQTFTWSRLRVCTLYETIFHQIKTIPFIYEKIKQMNISALIARFEKKKRITIHHQHK
jgi:hypothetical protein